MFRRYESRQTPTSGGTLSPKGIQHTTLPVVLVNIWQASSCRKFMQHLETCLLIAEADRILCHLMMFLTTWCTKWNTAAIKHLLLFMAGLVYWVFAWEMRRLSKSSEIRFRVTSFSKMSLLYFTLLDVWEGLQVSNYFGFTWWHSGSASRLVSLSNYCS